MKIKSTIVDILKSSCVIFTVVSLIVITISDLARQADTTNPSISKSLWQFFALSVFLAFANRILKISTLSKFARLGLHFSACAVLYFITIVVMGGFLSDGRQMMVALLLYLVIYLIFTVIYLLTKGITAKNENKKEKYESMFK